MNEVKETCMMDDLGSNNRVAVQDAKLEDPSKTKKMLETSNLQV